MRPVLVLPSAASFVLSPPRYRRFASLLAPTDSDADVAWHSAREINYLKFDPVAERLQVVGPQPMELLRNPSQGFLPARTLLANGSASIGTKRMGKAIDLNLRQSICDRALDDPDSKANLFMIRGSRRLAELIDQCPFFGIGQGRVPRALIRQLRFIDSGLLHDLCCRRNRAARNL